MSFREIINEKLIELETVILQEHHNSVQKEVARIQSCSNVDELMLEPLLPDERQRLSRGTGHQALDHQSCIERSFLTEGNFGTMVIKPEAAGDVQRPVELRTASDASENKVQCLERVSTASVISKPSMVHNHASQRSSRHSDKHSVALAFKAQHAAPRRAFVVNVRRLVDLNKVFDILHELIKSTAIAAITLVASGSENQLRVTSVFIFVICILFSRHSTGWDRLDTHDLEALLPLLSDDVDRDKHDVFNPNRFLKAMSFTATSFNSLLWGAINFGLTFGIVCGWMMLSRFWDRGLDDDDNVAEAEHRVPWVDAWVDTFMTGAGDGDIVGMQLTVATLMFVLELIFEYLRYRETSAVLPAHADGGVWDPRLHGLPFLYRLLGLPSMWFTSRETMEDLKYWMGNAHNCRVKEIFPEEIAFLALSGDEERGELRNALADSKLFSARTREFELNEVDQPQRLNIDLCFFDTQLQQKDFPYPGEFHYVVDVDEELVTSSPTTRRLSAQIATANPTRTNFFASLFKKVPNFSDLTDILTRSGSRLGESRNCSRSDQLGINEREERTQSDGQLHLTTIGSEKKPQPIAEQSQELAKADMKLWCTADEPDIHNEAIEVQPVLVQKATRFPKTSPRTRGV